MNLFSLIRFPFGSPTSPGVVTKTSHAGFALPMALGVGVVLLSFGVLSIQLAQGDRTTAAQRRDSGASRLVSDSVIARVLVLLSRPNNAVLLTRNYDPLDPNTGRNYLGADTVPYSKDETTQVVDEWTTYDPNLVSCSQQLGRTKPTLQRMGSVGPQHSYVILAYRYDKEKKIGTLLLEGKYKLQSSVVAVKIAVEPILQDFPGILLVDFNPNTGGKTGALALRGRYLLGRKSNVYYNPPASADSSLTGISVSGDAQRPSYLNALWSSTTFDGASGDTVVGKIFGCALIPSLPDPSVATRNLPVIKLGTINTSRILKGTGGPQITYYQVDQLDLNSAEILEVDTTNGPVQINFTYQSNTKGFSSLILRNTAKIIQTRTDGKLPQVGDLRLVLPGHNQVKLYDTTCIQTAFLYVPQDEVRLLTSGPGCPNGGPINIEGVVWAEAILSSKNAATNRNVLYLGRSGENYDTTVTPGATSGIAVPDDLSSLKDILQYIDWPVQYRYAGIQRWEAVYH